MKIENTSIHGILKLTPERRVDPRGYFVEIFKESWFRKNVFDISFAQDNESLSILKGTLRGLHFQSPPFEQGKLIRCTQGAILDIAVDIRTGSPTFGKWLSIELTADNGVQLWIPSGFAHGFLTLSPNSIINYKVTSPYSQEHDKGLLWKDASIGINWPLHEEKITLSNKDKSLPTLGELPEYFVY
jgi:dTDP-4-dehydrorhamnose 3,5-epimerase